MQLKEACRCCGLTKKAIHYYEKLGLITPEIKENGYREYSGEDVGRLKEIAVLRSLGIPLAEISNICRVGDKKSALLKWEYRQSLKQKREKEQRESLARLAEAYDIEAEWKRMRTREEQGLTIQEKLNQAFPGVFGVYLSLHFGQFLEEEIKTKEQKEAYQNILTFLDNLSFPAPLERALEQCFPAELERLDNARARMQEAVEHPEAYLERNGEWIQAYLQYQDSEEYRQSEAFRLRQMMLAFHQSAGYETVFLENMRRLSGSYRNYCEKLGRMNELLLERHPEAGRLQNAGRQSENEKKISKKREI